MYEPGQVLPDDEWMPDAACQYVNPDLFFPGKSGTESGRTVAAKRVCRVCPVQSPCLARAVSDGEPVGVWGGLSSEERRRLVTEARRINSLGYDEARRIRAGHVVRVPLTHRPAVVFHLMSAGWDTTRVADAMGLTPDVVRTVRRTAEAAAAFRHLVGGARESGLARAA